MPLTQAERQASARKRAAAKVERLRQGHRDILAKLAGNDKTLAVELRAISESALNG